jgi:hypothetical protein
VILLLNEKNINTCECSCFIKYAKNNCLKYIIKKTKQSFILKYDIQTYILQY